MRSYLKSLTQSIYEKVQRAVQDEYIEPMTESEIYAIINRKRPKSSSSNTKNSKSLFSKESLETQQILDNIQRLSIITPQRQFKLLGDSYSLQVVSYRMKELKTKIQAVKEHMITNYGTHLQAIQTALLQIQSINNLASTRLKSTILRQRLNKLQSLVNKTMKITRLNIKLKNIKETVKIAQKIPNIKKMHLFQLKNINLSQINDFKQSIKQFYPLSKEKQLHCIKHLDYYIDKVSSQNLRLIITDITECISLNFTNQKYQKAIRDFIISRTDIQYQKLVIRLIEAEIRDKISQESAHSQQKNLLVFRSKHYIQILINLSKIFRWHRYNLSVLDPSQIQQKIRARNNSVTSNCSQKSQDKPQKYPIINLDSEISIKIHTDQVKTHACQLMDQCLKQQLEEMLFNQSIKNEEIFEILSLMNSFYQVAFSFSSFVFQESTYTIKQILMRKCYKLQQKGIHDLNQALNKQEENEWNRLPLLKNYRFKSIERTLQRINKLSLYDKTPSFSAENYKFLNIQASTSSQDIFEVLASHQLPEESFELLQFQFPYQKLQKNLSSYDQNDSPLPEHEDPEVVICKSSLTILSYFEQLLSMYFYFPIRQIRQNIIQKMFFYLDYYVILSFTQVYYLFNTFLSEMYEKMFFENSENLEQSYLQVRVKTLYHHVHQFVLKFQETQKSHNVVNRKNEKKDQNDFQKSCKESMEMSKYKSKGYSFIKWQIKKSKVSQENALKSRALATDSLRFLTAYLANIVSHIQRYTIKRDYNNEDKVSMVQASAMSWYKTKIQSLKTIYSQISDLLLTDITPSSTKIEFVLPIMKKIKWHEIQNTKEIVDYGSIILKNIKETYQKMKSMSKGQIPYYLVDKIFSFYWKTQLTLITKLFLDQHVSAKQKGGRNSKLAFEKLIDTLYEGLLQFIDTKPKSVKELSSLVNSSKSIPSEYASQRVELMKTSYIKIKNIFPILYAKDYQECQKMVFESLKNFDFIYKIQISFIKASESSSGHSQVQIEERVRQIDDFIQEKIIQKTKL